VPKYKINAFKLARCTYLVEADSPEDAIGRVGSKEHSTLIHQEILNEFVDEYGMSFEEAEALGIDVKRIRSEYNFDANFEHIEAIESIEMVK
jgi:hypothetical protein